MPLGRRRVRGDAAADARRRGLAAAATAAVGRRDSSALAIAWAVALVLYFALADVRSELGAVLVLIGAWQVLFYVAWRGWPFSAIADAAAAIDVRATSVVIASGILTYLVVHEVAGVSPGTARSARGVLRRGRPARRHAVRGLARPGRDRWWPRLRSPRSLAFALHARRRAACTSRARARDEWVAHVGLNAIGVSIILHVAIGRRWPFAQGLAAARPAGRLAT